jgi:hypothetical protein
MTSYSKGGRPLNKMFHLQMDLFWFEVIRRKFRENSLNLDGLEVTKEHLEKAQD